MRPIFRMAFNKTKFKLSRNEDWLLVSCSPSLPVASQNYRLCNNRLFNNNVQLHGPNRSSYVKACKVRVSSPHDRQSNENFRTHQDNDKKPPAKLTKKLLKKTQRIVAHKLGHYQPLIKMFNKIDRKLAHSNQYIRK